ncbi:unnamed protein product [Didymodactylos carnosus]|nr:unnamed protein product [Didymodactylos carnosus]CAF4462437.1 unnamed protein product [Didymodactylos carnosus]
MNVAIIFLILCIQHCIPQAYTACLNSGKALCLCCKSNQPATKCKRLDFPQPMIVGAPRYCCIPARSADLHNVTCTHLLTNQSFKIHYACAYPPTECPEKAELDQQPQRQRQPSRQQPLDNKQQEQRPQDSDGGDTVFVTLSIRF